MKTLPLLLLICLFFFQNVHAEQKTVDPNLINFNDYVHQSLPKSLLKRIRAITDVFEVVDGVSYEEAVDLYRRDFDPESNVIIFEEMARIYKAYCSDKSKCTSGDSRMDVYRSLLIRSLYPEEVAIENLKLNSISYSDATEIVKAYKLNAQPIEVIEK